LGKSIPGGSGFSSRAFFVEKIMNSQSSFVYATAEEVINAARHIMESLFVQHDVLLTSPELVRSYLSMRIGREEREIFCVMFLDNQNRLIATEDLFQGTIDGASVYPREVVKAALKHNAAAIVVAHNHPSGHPEPSEADKRITARLQDALSLVEVRLMDHFVVTGVESVSFAERGLL
jgi:DNA repair protein RadC